MAMTAAQASRFLAQATMGASKAEISALAQSSPEAWLSGQFALPRATSFWSFLADNGYNIAANINSTNGFEPMIWGQLISSSDQLRQRVGMALLDILVVSINGTPTSWRSNLVAAYLDVLWDNAFGNYRNILGAIAENPAMSVYLTFINNQKANATTGAVPDENFARELMQLFSIGLYQLNMDGTLVLDITGNPIETYTQADVSSMARVWTGWTYANNNNTTPDRFQLPLVNLASQYETGAKKFLGTSIPANVDAYTCRKLALDIVFAHKNVPPFVSQQLIKRLVTSNPSPDYVRRVAAIFANNGNGVRGDMKAVIKAVLLDPEARADPTATTNFAGKLREPVIRLTQWARAFNVTSPTNLWPFGDTSSSFSRLAESPGRSPSVFNFFRPGYAIPGTQDLVAPEFQLVNEASNIAYLNYIESIITNGAGEARPDYSALLSLVGNTQALLDELNLVLAANQISAATIAAMKAALDTMSISTSALMAKKVNAAILLVMAAPEYLILK